MVALAVIGVLVVGFFAMTQLRQELMPSIEFPALTVFTIQPGASPADVERGVTRPLETSMKGLAGLKELDSYSNEGVSIIVALFDYGTDMAAMQAAAQQATQRVQAALPMGLQPQVKALNFGDFPIIQLAVSSPLPPEQIAALLQQKAVPQLQQVPGVADVSLSGMQGSQLQIALKPLALVQYGVGVPAVISALTSANISMPAGTLSSDGETVPVRVTSEAVDIDALKALPVKAGTGVMGTGGAGGAGAPGSSGAASAPTAAPVAVTLGDVADIQVVPTPATSITRTNGKPSVGIAISKAGSGNVVDISKGVAALLPALQADLGEGTSITVVVDQAPYITQSISSMWREGLLGAVFAILVILLFLRSWRSTVVAGMSIPLSVIIALIVLWGRGFSLNMLTLAGLTIAIGRVIDDSIVVLENSYRHIQEGDDVMTAAEKGTREVTTAVTASTLTTVAVFLPLGFVHGIASEFFRPFALTVTFALLASLLVALTVVPVGVTWLLNRGHVPHKEKDDVTTLQRSYLPALRWAISHKIITIVAAVAVFAGSMMLVPQLKTNLLDNSAQTTLTLTQVLPPGTETAITAEAAAKVEEVLANTDGVGTYQVTIGSTGGLFGPGGGTEASSARAQFSVTTEGTRPKADIVADLRNQIAALQGVGEVAVTDSDSSMGDNNSLLQVRVYADDPAVLQEANVTVTRALSGVPDLTNVSSNLSENRPQIAVKVDPAKVAASGLDAAQVGQYVALVLNGMPIGQLPTEQGPVPAVLTLPLLAQGGSAQLENLPLPGGTGLTTLSSVAAVSETKEPVQITHTDGSRTVTISGTATSNNVGATSNAVKAALKDLKLPAGARWEMAGASEQMGEVFTSLGIAMLVAILLVYLIMVATFRSLLNPLILLVSIPFAAVGAVVALFITGTSLGMPSLIGLLMLIGIVVTNAIVLLDLIEQFRDRGMDAPTAVVEGARRRLRPILMTAAATILALTPMALGMGKGSFLSGPLAVVVIGGLVSSTLLTLILVPVVYLSLDRLRRRPVTAAPAATAPLLPAESPPATA